MPSHRGRGQTHIVSIKALGRHVISVVVCYATQLNEIQTKVAAIEFKIPKQYCGGWPFLRLRCQLARAKCWSLPSTLVTRQTLIEVGQLVSILSPLRTMCVTNASQSSKLNLIHQNDQLLLRDCGYRNDLDLHSTIIRWVAKSTGEAKWPPAPVQFGHWPSHGSEIFCSSSRRVRGV